MHYRPLPAALCPMTSKMSAIILPKFCLGNLHLQHDFVQLPRVKNCRFDAVMSMGMLGCVGFGLSSFTESPDTSGKKRNVGLTFRFGGSMLPIGWVPSQVFYRAPGRKCAFTYFTAISISITGHDCITNMTGQHE